eukprot:4872621-Amphidinium_carterae.1
MALEFAGDTLLRDRDIVSAAVKQCGMALMYADKGLWYDRSLVIQVRWQMRQSLPRNTTQKQICKPLSRQRQGRKMNQIMTTDGTRARNPVSMRRHS